MQEKVLNVRFECKYNCTGQVSASEWFCCRNHDGFLNFLNFSDLTWKRLNLVSVKKNLENNTFRNFHLLYQHDVSNTQCTIRSDILHGQAIFGHSE